jgi:protein TonB
VTWLGHGRTIALAIALAGVAFPLAADPTSNPLGRPEWVRKPEANSLSRYYPVKAQFKDADGRALVECRIGSGGILTSCVVVEETPAGFGFGEAALNATKDCLLSETTSTGQPALGLKVRVPFRFGISRRTN